MCTCEWQRCVHRDVMSAASILTYLLLTPVSHNNVQTPVGCQHLHPLAASLPKVRGCLAAALDSVSAMLYCVITCYYCVIHVNIVLSHVIIVLLHVIIALLHTSQAQSVRSVCVWEWERKTSTDERRECTCRQKLFSWSVDEFTVKVTLTSRPLFTSVLSYAGCGLFKVFC